MKPLRLSLDANSQNVFAIELSDHADQISLVADTPFTLTVPTGAHFAVLSTTAEVFIKKGETIPLPGDEVLDGTAGTLNPGLLVIGGAEKFTLVSIADCVAQISYFGK